MKKIKSLFKRNYEDGTRQVYSEIVEGSEWVINGEGWATIKHDGTCCMVRNGKLYKRYDRKLTKANSKKLRTNPDYIPKVEDYKKCPENWEAAELEPNIHTGHWPGWLPVGEGPEDQWHREAFNHYTPYMHNKTFELVGPKIQGNPYNLASHCLWAHGCSIVNPPRNFEGIRKWLEDSKVEGIVWHNVEGEMVKIKSSDFGLEWPIKGI